MKVLWSAQAQHTEIVRQLQEDHQAAKAKHAAMVGRLTEERKAAEDKQIAEARRCQLMEKL